MTRPEAIAIFERLGCMDTSNVGCCHSVYVHWIERKDRTESPATVAAAYAVLSKKEAPPVSKQAALFAEKGADL